jgi:hypothetical protein
MVTYTGYALSNPPCAFLLRVTRDYIIYSPDGVAERAPIPLFFQWMEQERFQFGKNRDVLFWTFISYNSFMLDVEMMFDLQSRTSFKVNNRVGEKRIGLQTR